MNIAVIVQGLLYEVCEKLKGVKENSQALAIATFVVHSNFTDVFFPKRYKHRYRSCCCSLEIPHRIQEKFLLTRWHKMNVTFIHLARTNSHTHTFIFFYDKK